jgi:nicotinamidase-related amidase
MATLKVPCWFYRQYDADPGRDVPAEGYGGWVKKPLLFDTGRAALVCMHVWDCGGQSEYPGWRRAVEYIPRSEKIAEKYIGPLLNATRYFGMPVFHVADGSDYKKKYKGYEKAERIYEKHADEIPVLSVDRKIPQGEVHRALTLFRETHSFPGKHNIPDIKRGQKAKDFLKPATPLDDEPVVADGSRLHALCLEYGIDHLIYTGFAINWCLQYSPANMNEMAERGALCSVIREAVTAVENRESARGGNNKNYALWLTALKNGFVYDFDDFMSILKC